LKNCNTQTTLEFHPEVGASGKKDAIDFEFYFEGVKKDAFKPKIETFFKRVLPYCSFLKDYRFIIHSKNSFPHSSGIASSASGMSALALCVMSMEKQHNPGMSEEYFRKKASFLARLGSGSACRSIEGPLVEWGYHEEIEGSSDLFGISYPYAIHKNFEDYQDTILIVEKGQKKVSSSLGHNLMTDHPFAKSRFEQAHKNLARLNSVLKNGVLEEFIEIVETEALSLHAMMMSSKPNFLLMKPNTLEIINRIRDFREQTQMPVCFTLDAGANVHMLYPKKYTEGVNEFIEKELVKYCESEQYICDTVGNGGIQS
ncbi:MAG: diphosphomevalonate decarboxylase, partial [Gillisia sp.]